MIFFVIAVSAALVAAGIAEYRIHISRLEKIAVRILVNGTRGKSTVTRLIAAGLAEGGLRTCAKTTGSAARLILPDFSEVSIRRRKGASIMEHAWFVRRALDLGAQAIVAECMAIQPETIRTLELRLARSTIGVITNVRADHMDTMGTELGQVAETLALSVPERGQVFVGAEGMDEALMAVLRRAVERRKLGLAFGRGKTELAAGQGQRGAEPRFIVADAFARSMCARFGYPMFAENLALALAVCEECGVGREVALHGMLRVQPDPGVRPSLTFDWRETEVRAVNAFAANDVQSTLELWRREMRNWRRAIAPSEEGCRVLVFNHREDRAWRAFQLAEISAGIGADAILVFGMNGRLAQRLVREHGRAGRDAAKSASPSAELSGSIPAIRAMRPAESSAEAVLEAVSAMIRRRPEHIDILCAGNIKGPGMALTESLESMCVSNVRRA